MLKRKYTYRIFAPNNVSPQGLLPCLQDSEHFILSQRAKSDFFLYVSQDIVLVPQALELFFPFLEKSIDTVLFGSIRYLEPLDNGLFFIPKPQVEFYTGITNFPFIALSRNEINVRPFELLMNINNKIVPSVVGYTTSGSIRRNQQIDSPSKQKIPGISIVIPTCGKAIKHGPTFIDECMKSLLKSLGKQNFEIIVVFDGNKRPDYLADSMYDAEFVKLIEFEEKDFNFSKKVNAGVAASKFDRILLLNDDTKVITDQWNEISDRLEMKKSIGVIGALLLYQDEKIQHFGVTLRNNDYRNFLSGMSLSDPKVICELVTREVSAVTGAWLLTSRKIWDNLKGFDEMLPNNFGDIDFCLRVRAAGYNIIQSERIRFFHYESKSRIPTVAESELRFFQLRWGASLDTDEFLPPPLLHSLDAEKLGLRMIFHRALALYKSGGSQLMISRMFKSVRIRVLGN
jgi:GT2 family glycosyltransferase